MNARSLVIILGAAAIAASCSEKSALDRKKDSNPSEARREPASQASPAEKELQPREDEIAENCVAFLRATKVIPGPVASDCPGCATEGTEVLMFKQMHTDRVSCSADTCEVEVTINASFNPGSGQIGGGLTAWIPPEQRIDYLRGQAPTAEQVFRVKIIYKRTAEAWRAIEFDKVDPK